jgi:small subunit ribosomal protein S9
MIYTATGRRKEATAKVILKLGTGNISINKIDAQAYLQYNLNYLQTLKAPLLTLNLENSYDFEIVVKGGGLSAQTDASRLGISRVLCELASDNRPLLKSSAFLTRDARSKERKKYGLKKARKAPQFSKR